MPFVMDCSVTMAWVFSDEANTRTDALRERLINDMVVVPALWSIEVANVLLTATHRGRISQHDWPRIGENLSRLPIEIDAESHARALNAALPLAFKYSLSVYDAMYLELAQRMKLALATLDKQLAAACQTANIEVI